MCLLEMSTKESTTTVGGWRCRVESFQCLTLHVADLVPFLSPFRCSDVGETSECVSMPRWKVIGKLPGRSRFPSNGVFRTRRLLASVSNASF